MSGPSMPEQPQSSGALRFPNQIRGTALYINAGIICSIIAIFILPEIFGSAAIILGGYAWRLEYSESKNRGLIVIIIGIITMLVGIYYTSFFGLYNILP